MHLMNLFTVSTLYLPIMAIAIPHNPTTCFSTISKHSQPKPYKSSIKLKDSSSSSSSSEQQINRRTILQKTILSSILIGIQTCAFITNPAPSIAMENSSKLLKPNAPLETLLPATRFRKLLDKSIQLTTDLAQSTIVNDNSIKKQESIQKLEVLLLTPQNYNTKLSSFSEQRDYKTPPPPPPPPKPAKQYIDSYRQARNELPLLAQPGAMLVQMGEVDTWKRLKRKERLYESQDPVRAAFNYYTTNLNFDGNKFAFTAPKEERSKLIREDKIPDVKTVIASDMGMRYLYRNEVLERMEDARAELRYQLGSIIAGNKESSDGPIHQEEEEKKKENSEDLYDYSTFDVAELKDLLLLARDACDRWFSLIDERDVRDAMDVVEREEKENL